MLPALILAAVISGHGSTLWQMSPLSIHRFGGSTVSVLPSVVAIHQHPQDSVRSADRLTLRPNQISIGTRTERAGISELTGFPGYSVYVPPQCVGTARAPLVVLLHGGGRSGAQELAKFSSLADRYGMVVLAGSAVQPGRWDVIGQVLSRRTPYTETTSGIAVTADFPAPDVKRLDSALRVVLQTHAIDPARIALLGFSDGGSYSLFLGRHNSDVFSRVAALSALIPFDGTGPHTSTTQFFLTAGLGEPDMVGQTLRIARALRNDGYSVISQLDFRGHVDNVADEDIVWRWLRDSWADPSVTKTVTPTANDAVTLTDTTVRKLVTLWGTLKRLPDSIRIAARTTHRSRQLIPIDTVWTTMLLMDLAALAMKYPYVANALKQAELTAIVAESYRTAVLGVDMAQRAKMVVTNDRATRQPRLGPAFAPVSPTSVLGKNMLLFQSNRVLWEELKQSGILVGP